MEDFKHKGPEHTEKFKAGRHRTYFFDVYSTRKGEFYLTVTESKKRADGKGYERHKIFLYKEDLNRFLEMLTQSVNEVKDRMPEYDYDEFARRQAEWESQRDSRASAQSEDGEMEEMEVGEEATTSYINNEVDGATHVHEVPAVHATNHVHSEPAQNHQPVYNEPERAETNTTPITDHTQDHHNDDLSW